MKNEIQQFSLPHGLLSLNILIEIAYKNEELYGIFMENLDVNIDTQLDAPIDRGTDTFNNMQIPTLNNTQGMHTPLAQQTIHADEVNKTNRLWKEANKEIDNFGKNVFLQLGEYFLGKRIDFDIPLKPLGTDFQLSVWKALTQIPYGQTCSYKDIAYAINNEKSCRAVGMANNRNPISFIIPCHRVIGANGKLVGYGGGLPIKSALLDLEKRVSLHTR